MARQVAVGDPAALQSFSLALAMWREKGSRPGEAAILMQARVVWMRGVCFGEWVRGGQGSSLLVNMSASCQATPRAGGQRQGWIEGSTGRS